MAPEEGFNSVLYAGDMTCSLAFLALAELRYLYLCCKTMRWSASYYIDWLLGYVCVDWDSPYLFSHKHSFLEPQDC